MFRRPLLAATAALLLGSCSTTGGVATGITIAGVQNAAVAICAFLPTANTVGNILAAGNPLLVTAEAVAEAICAAVGTAPTVVAKSGRRRLVAMPMVNGVPIQGKFLR